MWYAIWNPLSQTPLEKLNLCGSILNTCKICFMRVINSSIVTKLFSRFLVTWLSFNDFFFLSLNEAFIFLKLFENLPLLRSSELCSQTCSEDIPVLSLHSCTWQQALHTRPLPKRHLDPPNALLKQWPIIQHLYNC